MKPFKIKNDCAALIVAELRAAGFDAYIVGGCVRDSLLGTEPKDWDICTSATTEDMRWVFNGYRIYSTGEKHGTLTIGLNDEYFEVTTFRKDGKYSDSRHPDTVEFVTDIKEDLLRRDFTINAIAFNNTEGYIDPYGGQEDINNRIIRCVGYPEDRFSEDPLRVLRALRFAAKLGFSIDNATVVAMYNCVAMQRLNTVSKERIRDELVKIITAPYAYDILHQYYGIIAKVVPYIKECIGFNQNNKYHSFDVYEHSLQALKNYPGDDGNIKIALFLHDIGKPYCYTEDENGGHFHGHPAISKKKTEYILDTLRFSNKDKDDIIMLVENHDIHIEPTKKCVHRAVCNFGAENLYRLFQMQKADILAHSPLNRDDRYKRIITKELLLKEIVEEASCFSLKDLAVKGKDLIAIGIPQGKEIGATLQYLLNAVIDGRENNKEILLDLAKEYIWYQRTGDAVKTQTKGAE